MTVPDYQQAVQTLRDRIGNQWQGAQADGRDEMERVLRDELGYDRGQAHDVIDAMLASGTLHYHHDTPNSARDDADGAAEATDTSPVVPLPVGLGAAGGGAGGLSSSSGAPLPVAALANAFGGYWQIGHDTESDESGRKGQVKVDY